MQEDAVQSKYELISRIGSGAFSQVFYGVHLSTKCNVAVKIVDFDHLEIDDQIGIFREVVALLQLNHPNIVTIYNYEFIGNQLYIYMEYLPNGTLLDKVVQMRGFTEEVARFYFKDILSAIFYLHKVRGIVHRDLKLQNVMISNDNHAKLIDFGFCNSMNKSNMFKSFVGTPGFTAPEIIGGERVEYSEACDIFSLGVCLFSMVAGRHPFQLQNQNRDVLVNQIQNLEFPERFSPELKELLKEMLLPDPDQRISLERIIISDWLQSELKPTLGLKSMIDLRYFNTKDSLKMASRKNILKPNLAVVHSMKNYGYSPERVITDLRRGRVTDGTAAYLILMNSLSRDELKKLNETYEITQETENTENKKCHKTLKNVKDTSASLRKCKKGFNAVIKVPTTINKRQRMSHLISNESMKNARCQTTLLPSKTHHLNFYQTDC